MQKISMHYITKVLVAASFFIMVIVFFSGCRSDILVDLNNKETVSFNYGGNKKMDPVDSLGAVREISVDIQNTINYSVENRVTDFTASHPA